MSRLLPVDPCNQRSTKDTPISESIPDLSDHYSRRTEPDQPDVTSWDSALNFPGDSVDIRRLDEASVDACFSNLSELLTDLA